VSKLTRVDTLAIYSFYLQASKPDVKALRDFAHKNTWSVPRPAENAAMVKAHKDVEEYR